MSYSTKTTPIKIHSKHLLHCNQKIDTKEDEDSVKEKILLH